MRLPNVALPAGELRAAYLHWTAGDYATCYDAYHFCITAAPVAVVATRDLRANMRDVREPGEPYAAHTAGRNSFAAGIAICGMLDATPHDFGRFPLRDDAVALACALVARLCATYGIAVTNVRTHAEAALEDGYYGARDGLRWDIARLVPAAEPLREEEAAATGDVLRARVMAAR